MIPYERDAFHAMLEEDAYKEMQRQNGQPNPFGTP